MADQLPIITRARAVSATVTPSTSLIGRGLSAIQRKETGLAGTDLDARYRQARDIYDRIINYGLANRFNSDGMQREELLAAFQQLVDQGYGKAYYPLLKMYQHGQVISNPDGKADQYRLAFDWCFANQTLNDPEIWTDLGSMYINGRGVEQNVEQAIFWNRKAAERGYAEAEFVLGWMYEIGYGVKCDSEQAVFLMRKAAEHGYTRAQYKLGVMYSTGYDINGRSVGSDSEQALFWIRKAAEQDHADAQYELACMYEMGFRVERNDEQAIFWNRKAAEQGLVNAQKYLTNLGINWKDA